jgi:plasmid stabilization system protein ParE
MPKLQIIWSTQSKESLKEIYDYYKVKSLQGAKNIRSDLMNAPRKIIFAKQYQVDEINPKYRRIVVRDYKLLYKESGNTIVVMDIVGTKQSPEVLKEK